MKKLYLVLGFLFISMFTWGQGLDGIVRFNPEGINTDGRGKRIEVEFTYRYNLDDYPVYQMKRDIVNYDRTNFGIIGAEVEVYYTSRTTGIWQIYIPENSTSSNRRFEFSGRYASLIIVQTALPSISVFNVSGDGTILPGQTHRIVLSGSQIGITYSLIRNDTGNTVKYLNGTGAALQFDGDYEEGIYKIVAWKDNYSKDMNGRVRITYPSILSSITSITPLRYNFPKEGGWLEVTIETSVDVIPEIRFFEQYAQMCNQGLRREWDNNFQIVEVRPIGWNKVLWRINAERCFETLPPRGVAYFGNRLYLDLGQQDGDGISIYDISGGGVLYNSSSSAYIKLSGTQEGYTYRLLKNGEVMKTFTGTGQEYSNSVSEPGRYTIEWYYKNRRVSMRGSALVERADPNSYTSNKSYILTRYYIEASMMNVDAKYNTTVSYVDGLGRPLQDILVKASPTGKNLYSFHVYDSTGRETKTYLPLTLSGNPTYNQNIITEQTILYQNLYGANNPAYSEVRYDNSSNDKILEQSSPGASWEMGGGYTTRFAYRKNTTEDQVKKFILDGTSLVLNGFYPANTLVVSEITNPQGDISFEFKDSRGHVVAKRTKSGSEQISTYQVFDDLERIRYVIPPAQEQLFTSGIKTLPELQKYCFYTEYDEYGRVYKQYIPGAGYKINLYDKRSRLVLSQNSQQRLDNKWEFIKYDEYNRSVITGICSGSETEHKTALASQTVFGERRGTALHGYTNVTYPVSVTENECLNILYFDDYNWAGQSNVSFSNGDALDQVKNDNVVGKATGKKTKILGISTNQWLLSAIYYNSRYESIQHVEQLYPSGISIVSNLLNFKGNVIQVKHKQTLGNVVNELNKYFTYDEQGRLLKTEQQITGDNVNGKVLLSECTYDEFDRMSTSKIHNGAQTITYSYEIGGAITSVSSPSFSYYLDYDKVNVSGASARYDGNINAIRWKNGNGVEKAYIYTYDKMNHLNSAAYKENNGEWTNDNRYKVSGLTYDQNGNIKTLIRNNSSGTILHNLTYTYADASNANAVSSIVNNGSTKNFSYDENGNMISDGNRGVTISYNEIKLPKEISKSSEIISYIYNANGEKLAMKVGSSLTYYRGLMVYSNDNLSHIIHPEGLTRKSGNSFVYDYALCDHLGSTRVLLEASGNTLATIQTMEYYPFGLAFQNNNLDKNKYLYNGKEYQDASIGGSVFGTYDFGARLYDPVVARWFCQDPAVQMMSPYCYCGNNPVIMVDPNGEFSWLAFGIGAAFGTFSGGMLANGGQVNPFKWDWSSGNTWGKILGGAVIGGMSGAIGAEIAASGGFMANTIGTMAGTLNSSLGMSLLSDGLIDPGISFGFGNLNLRSGKFDFFLDGNNKWYEDLGYGLGAFATLSDVWSGIKGSYNATGKLRLETDGHSQLYNYQDGKTFSWGAMVGGQGSTQHYERTLPTAFKSLDPVVDYTNSETSILLRSVDIKRVNIAGYQKYINTLPGDIKYKMALIMPLKNMHCTIAASRALLSGGVFNIPILRTPMFLDLQMRIRDYAFMGYNLNNLKQ